ncbi:MAG: hypothetical protein HMLKMBBP_01223 [Planctomycetes bacterium]|nr:hypothetical protein [Planctomycetota bacterium]
MQSDPAEKRDTSDAWRDPLPHDDPVARDRAPLRLRLADLEKTHLAGEGNFLWKIPLRGGVAVLKVYYGSRSPLLYWKKTFGNLVLTGRSSHMPAARCATEMRCIDAWEKHGFTCFPRYPEVRFEDLPDDGYMVFGFVPGKHFRDYFRDPKIPAEEKLATWRRWVPEWHRRHRIAVETGDNHLIHENGDVKHVMLWKGGFVYFDFEMIYTGRNLRTLVGREILAYMRSVGRFFGPELYEPMMDALVACYPDKALLMAAWECAYRDPNLFMRFARFLDRTLKPANRKPFSKYGVARDLKKRLDALSLSR